MSLIAKDAISGDGLGSHADDLPAWFLAERFQGKHFVIALSGGVDSAVVAKAASLSGCSCVAVTADSPSVARRELDDALMIIGLTGLRHQIIPTRELEDAAYAKNDGRRCYHCKSNLFAALRAAFPDSILVTGTNRDDLDDYRPGLEAAREADVVAPLAELGITKAIVRRIAHLWGLPISEKPASPCLASRLAYGVEVTEDRLQMIEAAELVLQRLGLGEFRVRYHEGDLARIEVPVSAIGQLASEPIRATVAMQLRELGFRFVALDLEGFRSGNLNQLVQIASR